MKSGSYLLKGEALETCTILPYRHAVGFLSTAIALIPKHRIRASLFRAERVLARPPLELLSTSIALSRDSSVDRLSDLEKEKRERACALLYS